MKYIPYLYQAVDFPGNAGRWKNLPNTLFKDRAIKINDSFYQLAGYYLQVAYHNNEIQEFIHDYMVVTQILNNNKDFLTILRGQPEDLSALSSDMMELVRDKRLRARYSVIDLLTNMGMRSCGIAKVNPDDPNDANNLAKGLAGKSSLYSITQNIASEPEIVRPMVIREAAILHIADCFFSSVAIPDPNISFTKLYPCLETVYEAIAKNDNIQTIINLCIQISDGYLYKIIDFRRRSL